MKDLSITLAICASVLHVAGYTLYVLQALSRKNEPNPASWAVWAFLSVVNAASYAQASKDQMATLQFYSGSVACMFAFLLILAVGRFSKLGRTDLWCLVLGFAAISYWSKTGNAQTTSYLMALIFSVSFIPTLRGVWDEPRKERPQTWIMWTIAFALTCGVVVLGSGIGPNLITPAILLVLHSTVGALCIRHRLHKKKGDYPEDRST